MELSNGHRASVVFHERKELVEILARPLEAEVEAGLGGLLIELGFAPEAITWIHSRIDRQALFEASRSRPATSGARIKHG
jgi:hypothetical protein